MKLFYLFLRSKNGFQNNIFHFMNNKQK